MNFIVVTIVFILTVFVIRFAFRKLLDLPAYNGKLLADNSKIDNLMPEKQFWEIIHSSQQKSRRDYRLQCVQLTEILESFQTDEIIQFDRTFTTLMAKSYSFRLWEPAYALNGGCSDDAFEYFRSWLIAQGRNKFYWTLKFPRLLFLIGVKELVENYEGIAYCSYNAFQNKTGNTIPVKNDIEYADGGEMFKETEAFLRYPELALLAW